MLFNRKMKFEVVPESEYTDFTDRFNRIKEESEKFATRRTVVLGALLPTAISVPIMVNSFSNSTGTPMTIPEAPAEQLAQVVAPVTEPLTTTSYDVLARLPALPQSSVEFPSEVLVQSTSPEMIPTGFISDASTELLATALDPVIEVLKAISLPIASVIIVGACFMFMFNNAEKGYDMIMKAGLGYILIQLSPMLLKILRQVGESVG